MIMRVGDTGLQEFNEPFIAAGNLRTGRSTTDEIPSQRQINTDPDLINTVNLANAYENATAPVTSVTKSAPAIYTEVQTGTDVAPAGGPPVVGGGKARGK